MPRKPVLVNDINDNDPVRTAAVALLQTLEQVRQLRSTSRLEVRPAPRPTPCQTGSERGCMPGERGYPRVRQPARFASGGGVLISMRLLSMHSPCNLSRSAGGASLTGPAGSPCASWWQLVLLRSQHLVGS